jgi:hypothetical protein
MPSERSIPGCPSCGDELFTREFGCPRCGHGRKSFVARHGESLVWIGFVAMLLIGACGVGIVGLVAPSTFVMGVLVASGSFVVTGASLFAFGIRAIRDPTSLRIVDSAGTDASGTPLYKNARNATREQGITAGVTCLIVGLALVAIGVAAGPLALALGMLRR